MKLLYILPAASATPTNQAILFAWLESLSAYNCDDVLEHIKGLCNHLRQQSRKEQRR
jgi:hypothetical protein